MKSKDILICAAAFVKGGFDVLQKAVTITVVGGFIAVGVYAAGYNGSGVYSRHYDFTDDAAGGVPILASRFDDELDEIASALSSVMTRDGQAPFTSNVAFGSNRITGLAAGASGTDGVNLTQSQINLEGAVAATGAVDALVATFVPALTSLQDKQLVRVIASGANTSATPSFTPNSLTTRTIVKHGGRALLGGDISGAEHVLLLQYDLGNTRWELLNPAFGGDTTAFGASLANDAAASNGRTTLGLGTSATVNTGTSGATIPLLNGANTWSAAQSLTEALNLDAFQTIASVAGTTDIGAATGNLVTVSGTNAITGLGTAAEGVWRIVRASGAWSITFSATVIGPNGETTGTHTATAEQLFLAISRGSGTWNFVPLLPRFTTQSTQETGTANNVVVTPGRQQFHPSAAKAWCQFNGATAGTNACTASYNVDDVTKAATGRYAVNFTTDFSGTDYVCVGMSASAATLEDGAGTKTGGSFPLRNQNSAGTAADDAAIYVVCYGDQ